MSIERLHEVGRLRAELASTADQLQWANDDRGRKDAEIERLRAEGDVLSNWQRNALKDIRRLEAQRDELLAALQIIACWARAYPLKAFPEPDFAKAAELLKAGGITLDAVSASNMRHVVTEVARIADAAIAKAEGAGKNA
jgi:hypothetical protein